MSESIIRTPNEVLGPLNEIEARSAPKLLYLAGDESLLSQGPRVSIVGRDKQVVTACGAHEP